MRRWKKQDFSDSPFLRRVGFNRSVLMNRIQDSQKREGGDLLGSCSPILWNSFISPLFQPHANAKKTPLCKQCRPHVKPYESASMFRTARP